MIKVTPMAMTRWLNSPDADDEDIISYCARVSNPSNQENFDTSEKLLKYCIRKKHWSIFTMSNIIMEVEAPRDITRQMLRHSFHFQEFSQRYANSLEHFEMVVRETRLQDTANRQNSLETNDSELISTWEEKQKNIIKQVKEDYTWALENGIAKECARVILPEGLTQTRMYVNGTVRLWYHYCQVRTDPSTQKEHRILAQMAWEHLQEQYPFLQEIGIEG